MARLSFRMSAEGVITGMIDEAAYWAALEDLLEQKVGRNAGDEEARGSLWAMRQTRNLPLTGRLDHLAGGVLPIIIMSAPPSIRSWRSRWITSRVRR